LTGIIADRWVNAEKLYGILHILGGLALCYIPQVDNPSTFYWIIFGAMLCYMPTISLSNSVAYNILKNHDYDVVKVFPPIRVWGTIGFIAAMWITNLSGIYAFTLPQCPPQKLIDKDASFAKKLGLDAFKLFGTYKMAVFFIFSMFLGAALQLTNMYGDVYLSEFGKIPEYADSFVVQKSTLIMSISQFSETAFILAIPFFLKRFGIKQVMLISMLAWVLRFGFFAYGDPSFGGTFLIIMSCIVYGMAFDFFNISGSLFIETTTDSTIRSSAQGLFMMMSNGFGAFFGGIISGQVIDTFFTHDGVRDWHNIWLAFAAYALVIAIAFSVLFKHKHNPEEVAKVSH
jgi:NHS family xanthosine MFS transporter